MNYEILVGEPWNFQGPDGNSRILARGVGVVYVIDHDNHVWGSYLLKVKHPFIINKQRVELIIFQPRHSGDTIYQIAATGGMVGVYQVKEGVTVQKEQQISGDDLIYCIIGQLNIIPD